MPQMSVKEIDWCSISEFHIQIEFRTNFDCFARRLFKNGFRMCVCADLDVSLIMCLCVQMWPATPFPLFHLTRICHQEQTHTQRLPIFTKSLLFFRIRRGQRCVCLLNTTFAGFEFFYSTSISCNQLSLLFWWPLFESEHCKLPGKYLIAAQTFLLHGNEKNAFVQFKINKFCNASINYQRQSSVNALKALIYCPNSIILAVKQRLLQLSDNFDHFLLETK